MAEMTALKYLEEKARMTKKCKIVCLKCLLSPANNGDGHLCHTFECEHPEQAIAIVQKWAQEHPRKTLKDDFFEKLPRAEKLCDGIPTVCAAKLGHLPECPHPHCEDHCGECRNQPLEVEG